MISFPYPYHSHPVLSTKATLSLKHALCQYDSLRLHGGHDNNYHVLPELPGRSPASTPASTIQFHITNTLIFKKKTHQIIIVYVPLCKTPLPPLKFCHGKFHIAWPLTVTCTSLSWDNIRHSVVLHLSQSSQNRSFLRVFALAIP